MLGYDLNDPKLVNGPGVKGVLGELLFIVPPFVVVVVFWCAFFCCIVCCVSLCSMWSCKLHINAYFKQSFTQKKNAKIGRSKWAKNAKNPHSQKITS